MTDFVAVAVVLFFAVRGYFKGLIAALTGILGPLLGYAAVLLFARTFGTWIAHQGYLKPLFAYPVASISLFFVVQMTVNGLSYLGHNWLEQRAKAAEGRITKAYWLAGGLVGTATGCAFAVIVVWGMTFFNAVSAEFGRGEAAQQRTRSQEIAGRLLSKAVTWVLDVKGIENAQLHDAVTRVVEDPSRGIRSWRRRNQDDGRFPDLGSLKQLGSAAGMEDAIGKVSEEDSEQLLAHPQVQRRLTRVGIPHVDEARIQGTFDDPRIQKLLKKHQ